MTNPNTSPATTAAPQELALRTIEEITARYLDPSQPMAEQSPAVGLALIKTVHDVARAALGNSSRKEPAAACAKCGMPHGRVKLWNGEPEDLCDACEKARLAEIRRIFEHYEKHPDECCCATYLGRSCCMAPMHGHLYRALCIENGERFITDFRAKNWKEALELGKERAAGWGGECISVRKLSQREAA